MRTHMAARTDRANLELAPKDYEIEQRVIYLIWRPSQAEVSEIGLTKLAEG